MMMVKPRTARIISTLLLWGSTLVLHASSQTSTGPSDLSPLLQGVVEKYGLVGVAAFAASSTGVCAVGSAGTLAISKPNSPIDLYNSPWKSGSLAKSMTASLVAMLVKDEAVPLTYDTTLGEVFPEDATNTPYESVTLEDLLGHRGGFQRDFFAGQDDLIASGVQFVILTGLSDHDMPLLEQRRVLVKYALTWLPPVNTPGTAHLYSNLGYTIAAIMMESVTGVSFEDLLTHRLFVPLGLDSGHFGCVDHFPQYAPLGHATDPVQGLIPIASASLCDCMAPKVFGCDCLNEVVTKGIPFMYGGGIIPFFYAQGAGTGGINFQLGDWVRYYQWHLAGELGTDTSGLLAQEDFHRLHSAIGGENTDEFGHTNTYGHGWVIEEPNEDTNNIHYNLGPLLHHDGTNNLWVTAVWMLPEVDRLYFFATNSDETKDLKPLGDPFNVIVKAMISDGYEEAPCPAIDILDGDRIPGEHETCPMLVYGEFNEKANVTYKDAGLNRNLRRRKD